MAARRVNPHLRQHIELRYDAMNRRDVEALRELRAQHPGFIWESNSDELDAPGRLEGKELAAYTRDLFQIFDELETEVIERIDVDPDHMICVVRHRVRGAASGVSVDRQEVHLWTARDDRLESLREFGSVEEARRAAAAT
jgi:ketosteroid isomerase-like protein